VSALNALPMIPSPAASSIGRRKAEPDAFNPSAPWASASPGSAVGSRARAPAFRT
jgi:hypothetical protein